MTFLRSLSAMDADSLPRPLSASSTIVFSEGSIRVRSKPSSAEAHAGFNSRAWRYREAAPDTSRFSMSVAASARIMRTS
eukprot:CAMPEP_0115833528 /NCGR_PEP_ID=MMETSP0287-20121206/3218_2 /TAXON_ID=412157 /ORGANISM="Chrysochromulina rotalis, Strain UIO044" /LENGTH=78 /DNA_ID=CAMNT_0003286943 /DNA_START=367 /DNA_END=603 /DNA_ORIENTATION=-